jgi:CRP-like cAMP-binding protein
MESGSSATRAASGNLLLDSLPVEERERLLRGSKREEMPARRVLFEQDDAIETVYFPLSGVVSLVTLMRDGSVIEMATIGREGVVGVPMVLGTGLMSNARGVGQVDGEGLKVGVEAFRNEVARGDRLRALMDSYLRALFTLVGQNAACNRLHTMDQRCARWLLMTHDRVGRDQFVLTQEYLAQMLGSRRATVTEAAADLQDLGAIRYHRGQITIVNRTTLKAKSCECYEVVQGAFDSLYEERNTKDSRLQGSN